MFVLNLIASFFYVGIVSGANDVLFVVGGESAGERLATVEAVDLSGQQRSCKAIPDYPVHVDLAVAVRKAGQPLVCAGYPAFDECYGYEGGSWNELATLTNERYWARAVQLGEEDFIITGGYDGDNWLNTIEHFNKTGGDFQESSLYLPLGVSSHCIARVNDTHLVMAGGLHGFPTAQTWVYNSVDDEWWGVQNMPLGTRYEHSCGMAAPSTFIVTGGYLNDESGPTGTTELFDLATLTWTEGPALPSPRGWAASVQSAPDTPLYVVGGTDGQAESDEILQLDLTTETWLVLPERLDTPRSKMAAVLVEASSVDCL